MHKQRQKCLIQSYDKLSKLALLLQILLVIVQHSAPDSIFKQAQILQIKLHIEQLLSLLDVSESS